MAWAYATLWFMHSPLIQALAAAARRKITECISLDLSNMSWAYAELLLHNEETYDSFQVYCGLDPMAEQEWVDHIWKLTRVMVRCACPHREGYGTWPPCFRPGWQVK